MSTRKTDEEVILVGNKNDNFLDLFMFCFGLGFCLPCCLEVVVLCSI